MDDTESEQAFVLRAAEERGIRFVQLWFTDVLGQLKAFAIPAEELPEALAEGSTFDGSSIDGFVQAGEADLIAMPAARTFQSLPWRPRQAGVARMFCDILTPNGDPFEADPRRILKRVMHEAQTLGYAPYVGAEIDFFLFENSERPSPVDLGSYFDLSPLDSSGEFRRRVLMYLEKIGIPVKASYHEIAASQHGVNLRHADPLTIADSLMSFRFVVKEVAQELGLYATFMPKPIQGVQGSGLHVHLSIFEDDENAFFDETDTYALSKTGRAFMSGVLTHAAEITAVTNQWVNSYRRLVPGYEAPTDITWGAGDRSTLVRIPTTKRGKDAACRVEYRAPDAACNPYLALAVILAAGLDGIRRGYELAPEVPAGARAGARGDPGVPALPRDLAAALRAMQEGTLVRDVLGEHAYHWFVANKLAECTEHSEYVTQLEIDRFLPRL